jgi:hypothetical protein
MAAAASAAAAAMEEAVIVGEAEMVGAVGAAAAVVVDATEESVMATLSPDSYMCSRSTLLKLTLIRYLYMEYPLVCQTSLDA